MSAMVEVTSFYPVVEEHGLSRWWIYKQLRRLSAGYKRGVLPSGRKTASALVPYEEMMHLILKASKKKSIKNIVHRAWNVMYGRRMTFIASKSHGTWQKHYYTPRNKGKVALSSPEEFFELRPKAAFFIDNIDELEKVLSKAYFIELKSFLENIQKMAKAYIVREAKRPNIEATITNLDYEQFYQFMLDELLYGHTLEYSFLTAIKKTPKRSDRGSTKEFNTTTEGGIERFSATDAVDMGVSTPFQMDYAKLKQSFMEMLLTERFRSIEARRKSKMGPEDEKEACRLAAEDLMILDMVVEGRTDQEILDLLELDCTRMTITNRKKSILMLAKEHFAPLYE